ncbi:MAG: sugar isomerase domain-containing protein [Erysipelotrichaceae bacterium]|nr:sugar isomerase domain-containing protein [Erysipelotrichaceae bacterium]
MDIKKKYFDMVKDGITKAYTAQSGKIKEIAETFGQCMENGGVVQLFGVKHGEEFVNELNYRAGGIAPFHALRFRNLVLKEMYDQAKIDSGEAYDDLTLIDKFEQVFKLDDRDMYCLVSNDGTEKLVIELAKRAKEKGQKVVGVVNLKSYEKAGGKLLDYCDLYLDMMADDPDVAVDLDGLKVGQIGNTVSNVMAQMLTAEIYNYYVSHGKEAPVLLSANVKGADVHNNSLTDPYEGRIR